MTSKPASRRARATILAPRSWPSSPGLATSTRILWDVTAGLGEERPEGFPGPDDGLPVAGRQRPVEALAVAGPARDQVEMKVGHRLKGRRAVGLEQVEPVGLEPLADREGDAPGRHDGRLEILRLRLEERRRVALRHHQAV